MCAWLLAGASAALTHFSTPCPLLQGFLTAVLQNHARKMRTPIDRLSFGFDIMAEDSHSDIKASPSEGVYVYGLFLESANWDKVRWKSNAG